MPKDRERHIGHKLAAAIKIKDVTKAAVARHFGVQPPSIADWIKGTIAKEHYPRLVEYFGLPYEYWFGEAKIDPKLKLFLTSVLAAWPGLAESEKDQLIAAIGKVAGALQK